MPGPTVDLFTIAKSENKNVVQYVVRLDERCTPVGDAPVYAYWRMIQQGPGRTEPLLAREQPAYGLASQAVVARREDGGRIHLVLRAVASRPIDVDTFRGATGECTGVATTTIAGAPAHLFNVYAQLKWPFGVNSLLLAGWSFDGAHIVRETLRGG